MEKKDCNFESKLQSFFDEETWNSYKNIINYYAYFYCLIDDEIEIYEAKVDGNKLLIDNQLYVVEDGKTYLLEEKDSKWVATETKLLDDWYYVSDFFNSFSFSDFTYDETVQEYIYSKEDGNIIHSVYFTDGVLISFSIETTDENGKIHEVYYSIENFGNVTVEVPEYTKENS